MVNENKDLIKSMAESLERKNAEDVLKWSVDKYHPKIALSSSFGAEDVVLIEMLSKTIKDPKIFTLDTGRLPQETYNLIDAIREKYGVEVEVYFPQTSAIEDMTRRYGLNLFYKTPDQRVLCCERRKVEPLRRALSKLDAWITGLRREQAPSRTNIGKIELDEAHGGIVKVNPIADWTSKQVWKYIRENSIPYNKLYDRDYSSIGCAPCTRPIQAGENERAGRWWWEDATKECGLHHRFNKNES